MKQRGMKILALLLSFVLVLSLMPAAAAASITDRDIFDLVDKMIDLVYEKYNAGDYAAMRELQDASYALDEAYYLAGDKVTDDVVAAYNSALAVYLKYTATVPVTGVTLTPADATLTAGGEPVTLTAAVSPADATDKKVKWSTSSANVKLYSDAACTTEVGTDATSTLTVYAKGTAAGSATVTVTSNADATKTATCAVTVNAATVPVAGVTLTPAAATLTAGGDPVALTAAVSPADATDKKVKWSTSSANVKLYSDAACTTEVGTVATETLTVYAKALSAGYTETVTVTSNADSTKTATCTVTVTAKTYTVTVNPAQNGSATADKTTAAAGETVTLTVTPDNGYEVLAVAASDADNNQITVTNNSFFTMPAADVIVTVQFKEKTTPQPTAEKYTVTYDANNGSGETKTYGPYDAGTTYTVEGCSFAAPEGKVFDCWKGSDGKTYKIGSPVVLNADLTLTAQWKDKEKPQDDGSRRIEITGDFDIVFIGGGFGGGAAESWDYAPGVAPQRAWKVSLAPMVNGSAALGLSTGESGTDMNVYPNTSIYVFPSANPGFTLDKIIWSLIDGSASYDITEAKNFVMPAMDAVVYVTFKPAG